MTLHVFYTYTYTEGGINNVLIFFPPRPLGEHVEIPKTRVFLTNTRESVFFIFFLFDFRFLIIYTPPNVSETHLRVATSCVFISITM